jgi:hypothetical protein
LGIGIPKWIKENTEMLPGGRSPQYRKDYHICENGDCKMIVITGNIRIKSLGENKVKLSDSIRFSKVSGNFSCDGIGLVSLEGCPEYIEGNYSCTNNPLNDLKGLPERENVEGNMWII